jgi:hypothetical protein
VNAQQLCASGVLVVYTPEEVKRLHGVAGTLLSVIEREGRVLYESS